MKKLKCFLIMFSLIAMFIGGAYIAMPSLSTDSPKDNDYSIQTTAPSEEPDDDPDKDDDSDDIVEYTYKTYDNYFSDFSIPTSISEIEGSGTEKSPYIINSTEDFIFLSEQILISKYIEFNCDVVLNDETFNPETGEPSGGDRLIYEWKPISTWPSCDIEGNGHFIFGQYIGLEKHNGGIFRSSLRINKVANLNFKNVRVCSIQHPSTLGGTIENLINCTVLSGWISLESVQGKYNTGGLAYIVKKAENCVSYANLFAFGNVGGLFCGVEDNGRIKDCRYYGTIMAYKGVGGIIGLISDENIIVENCQNYGKIIDTVNGDQSGGIIGGISSHAVLKNCENYGEINTLGSGGLIGYLSSESKADIIECANYGKIISSRDKRYEGGFVCMTADNSTLYIKDSKNIQKTNGTALVGQVHNTDAVTNGRAKLIVDGVFVDIGSTKTTCYVISNYGLLGADVFISNVNAKVETQSSKVQLWQYLGTFSYCEINNVYLQISCISFPNGNDVATSISSGEYNILSMVVKVNGVQNVNSYYGSNFGGFYMSWKTGEIGLIALDGRGQFSAPLSEEQLINLGYINKSF